MASKEYVFLQGKAKWVRLHQPDTRFTPHKWKMTLYPNTESLDKIKALKDRGLKNVLSQDDDGYFMNFSRPTERIYNGKVSGFSPPEILEQDGKTPLRHTLVGNGSDVTLKVEVYTCKPRGSNPFIAARIESLRVDTLVPFTGVVDFTPIEMELIKGIDKVPPQPMF